MRAGGKRTGQRKRGELGLDLLLALLLFIGAVSLRWLYARAVVFPPLDDPAFYLTTAENLVAGRGLEVDALWSYQDASLGVSHPSHEHWMPLPTGLMAAAFGLQRLLSATAEPSLPVGQLPGLLLGALLAPLTFVVGRQLLPVKNNRWLAVGAGLLVAANATLSYQSASADSSAPFALLGAWALATAVRRPGDQGGYFGTGLLIALAYLTRADGLLLLVAVPLAWWLLPAAPTFRTDALKHLAGARTEKSWELLLQQREADEAELQDAGPGLLAVVDLVVAFALLVGPWLVRNYLAFGTPLPGSVLKQAWLSNYLDTFNYWTHPTWQSLVAQGGEFILAQRVQALQNNGLVFLLTTFPWGLLALPGFWLLRQRWAFFPALVYGLILFFVTALVFPVSAMSGTFYHSLGAMMPFLALAAVYATHRLVLRLARNQARTRPIFAILVAGLLVLSAGQVRSALGAVAERHQAERDLFVAAAAWLDQHAAVGDVVMTSQPYTLNYASGHPCIVLPGNEPPEAAWDAAQRYGARFLVVTQDFGRYPAILRDQPDPRFRAQEAPPGLAIYAIEGGQP